MQKIITEAKPTNIQKKKEKQELVSSINEAKQKLEIITSQYKVVGLDIQKIKKDKEEKDAELQQVVAEVNDKKEDIRRHADNLRSIQSDIDVESEKKELLLDEIDAINKSIKNSSILRDKADRSSGTHKARLEADVIRLSKDKELILRELKDIEANKKSALIELEDIESVLESTKSEAEECLTNFADFKIEKEEEENSINDNISSLKELAEKLRTDRDTLKKECVNLEEKKDKLLVDITEKETGFLAKHTALAKATDKLNRREKDITKKATTLQKHFDNQQIPIKVI